MGSTVSADGHSTEAPGGTSPPKIAHVLPFDQPRGAQQYARELVDHLGAGYARNLIVTLFEGRPAGLRPDIELGIRNGRLRAMGFDPRVVRRLRQTFRLLAPSIVVAHGGESAKYAAFALGPATPLIYLNIGSAHNRLSRRWSAALHRFYTGRSDVIVAVSDAVADEAREQGIPSAKIVVIPNGRDAHRYRPVLSSVDRRPRLIWIGQLDSSKRPEVFIDLIARLRASGYEVDASVVGDGPRAREIEALAEEVGVDMLGRRQDVPTLLGGSDLLVFTGAPPEGMPGVLIEAGMCGLATVSTRVPGSGEVIDDGKTGVLVDVDDRDRLLRAVSRLLEDEDLRVSMGERARERCVDLFSFDATIGKWTDLFDSLLNDRSGSSR